MTHHSTEADYADLEIRAHLPAPALSPMRGFTENPVTDTVNQTGILGDGYEFIGADHAVSGMLPPHECLRLADKAGLRVHDGLKMYFELVGSQCFAQVFCDT